MVMGHAASCTMAASVTAIATVAGAFPSSRLVYVREQGAESCPNEPAMRKAVAQRLGYDPFFPVAERTIVAHIRRNGKELQGAVQLIDAQGLLEGRREFKTASDQCEELANTMALAISIAIDPTSASSVPNPPQAKSGEPSEPPAQPKQESRAPIEPAPTVPASPDRATPIATRAPSLEFFSGVAMTGSFGSAPALAGGIALSFGVRRENIALGVEGRREFPASTDVEGGGSVESSLWLASVLPCFYASAVFLCAVGSLGSLRAEGVNLTLSQHDTTLYAAAGARVGFVVPLVSKVSLRPQVDLLTSLTRVELAVGGVPVWRAPPIGVLAGAGIFAEFP